MMESAWFMSYPHDVYARLRREAPVYWSPRDEVWAISKYEDIRWISKQPELFSNRYHIYVAGAKVDDDGQAIPDDTGMPRPAELRRVAGMGPLYVDNLVMADGARHRFLRKIASHAFTPKAINEIEAEVQRIAVELFDADPRGRRGRLRRHGRRAAADDHDRVDARRPARAPRRLPAVVRLLHRDVRGHAAAVRTTRTTNAKIGDIIEFRDYFAEQLKDRVVEPARRPPHQAHPGGVGGQAARARGAALDGAGAADRGQRDHPWSHRRRRQGARRAPRPAGDPRGVTRADARARSRSSCATSRRSRTCAAPRSTTSSSAGSRSSGATSSASSTRRPTATRTPGSAATSSTCAATPDPPQLAFGFAEHFCLGASLARREARIVLTRAARRGSRTTS